MVSKTISNQYKNKHKSQHKSTSSMGFGFWGFCPELLRSAFCDFLRIFSKNHRISAFYGEKTRRKSAPFWITFPSEPSSETSSAVLPLPVSWPYRPGTHPHTPSDSHRRNSPRSPADSRLPHRTICPVPYTMRWPRLTSPLLCSSTGLALRRSAAGA